MYAALRQLSSYRRDGDGKYWRDIIQFRMELSAHQSMALGGDSFLFLFFPISPEQPIDICSQYRYLSLALFGRLISRCQRVPSRCRELVRAHLGDLTRLLMLTYSMRLTYISLQRILFLNWFILVCINIRQRLEVELRWTYWKPFILSQGNLATELMVLASEKMPKPHPRARRLCRLWKEAKRWTRTETTMKQIIGERERKKNIKPISLWKIFFRRIDRHALKYYRDRVYILFPALFSPSDWRITLSDTERWMSSIYIYNRIRVTMATEKLLLLVFLFCPRTPCRFPPGGIVWKVLPIFPSSLPVAAFNSEWWAARAALVRRLLGRCLCSPQYRTCRC